MVKRLPPDLRNVHKLMPEEVKKTLAKAKGRVPDSHRVPFHQRRETMRDGDDLATITQPSEFASIRMQKQWRQGAVLVKHMRWH